MVAPKASSMEELQTLGFSVMKAPGNTASPAVGKSQGVANIPKTSPIIDITGSGAPSAGGGFCDLFATSGKSVDAVRKATSTLDTETAPRLVGLEKELKQAEEVDNPPKHSEEVSARRKWDLGVLSAKEAAAKAEKKAEQEVEKAKTEAKARQKLWKVTMVRILKNREILREEAAAKAEKKAAAKAEKKAAAKAEKKEKAEEEVEKAEAEAKAKAAKKKALEEAMELAEEAAKEAARLEAAKAAEEAAKLETEKAAKEAARTKALKEAEAAHLVKLKAAEEASRLEAEKVAAEAATKAKVEAERLEAEKNAEAQTLAAKAKIELSAALMATAKAKEAQEAASAMVPKDADIPKKVIGTDGKGQVILLRHTLGKRGSLGSQEKPPAKRSSMFLEEAQFFNIDELKRQRLEREAAEQNKLATVDSRRQPKPSAVGEPSNLSKGVTEQVPPGEFLPEAASTAAARLSVEDALRRGPNSEEFGRVLADNEHLWRLVQTMEKKISRMSRDIKVILERQPLPPPPMPKPAAATTSTMTGVERDGVRLHALIAQHNRLSAQISVTVSQMSDIITDSEQVSVNTQNCLRKEVRRREMAWPRRVRRWQNDFLSIRLRSHQYLQQAS